jgi:hypothetical protein
MISLNKIQLYILNFQDTVSSPVYDNVSLVGLLNISLIIIFLCFFNILKLEGNISFKQVIALAIYELKKILHSNMLLKFFLITL